MPTPTPESSTPSPGGVSVSAAGTGLFPATRWSLVVAANDTGPAAIRAMGDLLQTYWQPLYIFARRSNMTSEDAEDSVQGFYESLLTRDSLQTARQDAGKLRSFLLRAFQNYLRDVYRRGTRQKRGGGGLTISLDDAEANISGMAMDTVSPDVAYERHWVRTLLEQVLVRLRAEYAARGKAEQLALLEPALAWNGKEVNYAEVAEKLSMTESAIAQAVKRMRGRYRKLLEEEVAQTVDGPEAVALELEHLIRVISGS